jgi:4a-hydroxytetrahydrobiopterin dehydratase
MRPALLGAAAVDEALRALPTWRRVDDHLEREVVCASFRAAVALVNEIADLAEREDHHPDLSLAYTRLRITTTTHDAGGLTERDLRIATGIDALIAASVAPLARDAAPNGG